jgi:hypothetical protein
VDQVIVKGASSAQLLQQLRSLAKRMSGAAE